MVKRKIRRGDKKEEKDSKKRESQMKWIVFIMIATIFAIVLIYFVVQGAKRFNYGGLSYEEMNQGSIKLYHTMIPVKDTGGNLIANFNLYLRNDPRELRDISINEEIILKTNTIVSLSRDAEVGCDDAGIAGGNFLGFLKSAGIKISISYAEPDYAQEKNASYLTCDANTDQSVIIIKKGEENKITQERKDCFVIEFKDCDILKTTERFMVALYASSKGISV